MKVALMVVWDFYKTPFSDEIELGIITEMLRQNQVEVKLFSKYPDKLDCEDILEYNPELFGCLVYKHSRDAIINCVKSLKQKKPEIAVCLISTETQSSIEIIRDNSYVDFAIDGEPEMAFVDLAMKIKEANKAKNVKGLAYKEGDNLVINEGDRIIHDINILPFPARDFLVKLGSKCAQVKTSRGCYGQCSFCPSKKIAHKYRWRDVDNVLDELEMLKTKYGISLVQFSDKSFEDPADNPERLQGIVEGIIKRNLQIYYFVYFRPTIYKRIDTKLMELLLKSGLYSVCLGVEAGNELDLKLYNKNASLSDIAKSIELFRKNNIHVMIGFIIFNPYSSFDKLRDNVDFLEQYGFASNFSNLTNRYNLVECTPMYDKIKSDGLLREDESDFFSYNYSDERIGYLSKYLNAFQEEINRKNNNFRILEFYTKYFTLVINLYKRMFEDRGLDEAYNSVCSCEAEIEKIMLEINKTNSDYFRELLCLAENCWNVEDADKITGDYLKKNRLEQHVMGFTRCKKQLYKNLYSLGLDSYILI